MRTTAGSSLGLAAPRLRMVRQTEQRKHLVQGGRAGFSELPSLFGFARPLPLKPLSSYETTTNGVDFYRAANEPLPGGLHCSCRHQQALWKCHNALWNAVVTGTTGMYELNTLMMKR